VPLIPPLPSRVAEAKGVTIPRPLLAFDRNAAFANLELDAWFVFFPIGVNAKPDDDNKQGADDKVKTVPVQNDLLKFWKGPGGNDTGD
jgi:hypothetical protein